MATLCNKNFISEYAYVNGKLVKAKNFKKCDEIPRCLKNHELVHVNCELKKKHFRHKNSDDVNEKSLSEWHAEWQSNFPITEKYIPKISDEQIDCRRADILIAEHNLVVEIQHSNITRIEVSNRKADYKLNNLDIIWVVDGNKNINVVHLTDSNRIFIEFTKDVWKFESFKDCEFIFINICDLIYKVYPNNVKSNMIDVDLPFQKNEFINYIKKNTLSKNIDLPYQCNLYIKQQGAGNGKTYGLIQKLEDPEFKHYKCFIVVTKQHSAKSIIKAELDNQIENKQLNNIRIIKSKEVRKKYIITYENLLTNNTCNLIIATIDSLMFQLGDKNKSGPDLFAAYVNSIIDGYIERANAKVIKIGGVQVKLNKNICLIIDETQDLAINYAKAMVQIMRNKYVDLYVVGDKLQSLVFENNAFVYLYNECFPYINKKVDTPTNICRRFNNRELINFVNTIVPFKTFELCKVSEVGSIKCEQKAVKFIDGVSILANNVETSENKLNKEVSNVMRYYKEEVTINNYLPKDFLIITPFTTKNPLVNALELAINIFWEKKYNTNNDYHRYAIFHKSETGTSINLDESVEATRLVSIHTSKGDGRNVVFLIGMDDQSLIKFSSKINNIIYNSLIHVAVTRMKKTLYIRLIRNKKDNFHKLINEYRSLYEGYNINNLPKIDDIKKNIKYKKINENLLTIDNFEILENNILSKANIPNIDENEPNMIIDMSHHNIRYASMIICLYIKIMKTYPTKKGVTKQIYALFKIVSEKPITCCSTWKDYYVELSKKEPCILQISNKGTDYTNYYNIILENMNHIKSNIMNNIKVFGYICPYQSVILYYMILVNISGQYSDVTISELYQLTHIYSKSYNHDLNGHGNCLCNKLFNNNAKDDNDTVQKYLLNHYESIQKIGIQYDAFLKVNPNINWLIKKRLKFGHNNNYVVYNEYEFIGYDDDYSYIICAKPQINNINYSEILINSIGNSFCLQSLTDCTDENDENDDKKINNFKKFGNKPVQIILFSLNNEKYIQFNWKTLNCDLIKDNYNLINNIIKDTLVNEYCIFIDTIFSWFTYYVNEFKKNTTINNIPTQIIKKYDEHTKAYNNKVPEFTKSFFTRIKIDINSSKSKNKSTLLLKYLDKAYFAEILKSTIVESIENFLNIDNNISNQDDEYLS